LSKVVISKRSFSNSFSLLISTSDFICKYFAPVYHEQLV
jgi:hypothetical protein